MWSSTVGLVNGKHRYLTAETFGFKINSNGQALKKRQQWTIEPFPENLGPDGSISSAASVSSQCAGSNLQPPASAPTIVQQQQQQQPFDPNDPCILTFSSGFVGSSLTSVKSSSNGSSSSDQDACSEEHENVAIKSHLNKFLAVDSFGNVTCDSGEKTENARFTITICSMSQGRSKDEHIFWAFKNVERGYFLGTTDDGMICCNAKMPKSRNELWHLHLLPARGASFFVLKSLGRKRFARVAQNDGQAENFHQHKNAQNQANNNNKESSSQVQLDATITWGRETLFQFKYYEGGRYSLLTSNCLYLTNEGKCINWKAQDESSLPPPECLFTLEYHSGYLAFRDSFSHYLAAAGRSSVLRSRSIGVSRDELFLFEGAPIQVALRATFNDRWVSIKQGVDLTANQTETTTNFETFQMTYHKQTQLWSIMTHECSFWTVAQSTSTISACKPGDYEGLIRGQFKLVWSETDASCSLKFVDVNGQERWISARKSGQLFLATSANQTPVKFIMRFQNRRLLNLRPVEGSGFVGLKTSFNCKQLEANKTSPDSIAIEYSDLPNANGTSGVSSSSGILQLSSPPEVGPKPSNVDCDSQQRFNMFNVKLNSVKASNGFKGSQNNSLPQQMADGDINVNISTPIRQQKQSGLKEIDFGIDGNNNCMVSLEESTQSQVESKQMPPANNGSVESASAPSVASIISSFSNAKITNSSGDSVTRQQQQQSLRNRASSSVFKLASSFDAGAQQLQQLNDSVSDAASAITSCSSSSMCSSGGLLNCSAASTIINAVTSPSLSANNDQQLMTPNKTNPDQLAQLECCYLKTISNDRYFVVSGGNDPSIICDATNKACAQPWILELRSHNSVAIRASDNHAYVQLGTNGTIYLSRCDPKEASLWEF